MIISDLSGESQGILDHKAQILGYIASASEWKFQPISYE
jgi:hypothetical protein